MSLSCLSPSLPSMVLVKILGGPRFAASHHILSYLAKLVEFHGNCSLAVWAGVVPMLIKIVDSAEGEGLAGTSLAILLLLSKHEEGMTTIRNTDGVVSLLVDVLGRRCMLSKEGATELLVRLFDENEGCMRDAARLIEFSSLLANISIRGSAKDRETANLLMKKVTDADVVMRIAFECRPQVTIATAIIFCHRFFLRQSHMKNDRRVSSGDMARVLIKQSSTVFFTTYDEIVSGYFYYNAITKYKILD